MIMPVTLAFLFFPSSYATHISNQSYQTPTNLDVSWNFNSCLKEIACIMIWWRPKMKIHIPAARM